MRKPAFVSVLLAVLLGLAAVANSGNVDGYLGRWDLTLVAPDREFPTWIEVSKPGGRLQVRMVGRWGHARVLPKAEFFGAGIRFVSPKVEEGRPDDMTFEVRSVGGGKVEGETRGPDGTIWKIRGERAPELKRSAPPAWGKPIKLFDGKTLAGWRPSDAQGAKTWIVENGAIVSLGRGPELVTDRTFDDFKVHIEFKVAPGANSGIYLRGRYEVQVENDPVPEAAADRALGGVYGFLAPAIPPPRSPGQWQTYDITLVGRQVTVVLDGKTLISNQEIPGITGGALDSREGAPGPLYLQGSEQGRVEYRNVVVTPAVDRPRAEDVEFTSHGDKLSGSLVLPRDGKIHAAVVYIHGSGPQTRSMGVAQLFADAGIAALVYDKRGVGKSGGEYESKQNVSGKNVSLLADDAAAALTALAKHPAVDGVPLGFTGISQAGWIAPLAAQRSRHTDFLVMWSGPVCKVSEEDIYSKYTGDADRKTAPPYAEALAARTQPYIWPDFLGRDTDSAEDLARLPVPGFWIFGDNDASIPVDLSIARLESLRKKGHRYEYRLFPGLGHDNVERTFAVAVAWIKAQPRSQLRAAP